MPFWQKSQMNLPTQSFVKWVLLFSASVLAIDPMGHLTSSPAGSQTGTSHTISKDKDSTFGTTAKKKAPSTTVASGKTSTAGSGEQSKKVKSGSKGHKSSKRTKQKVRGQREIEPPRVREIQQALATAGYFKEEPTGKWDAATTQAMSAYQTDNGFKVTGKPDALSLKKLGL
jgi:peptidoglycan hydrolase-like protein with peptidoglycan-binding domain